MKITTADMTASQKRKLSLGLLMLFMFTGIIAGTLLVIKDADRDFVTTDLFSQRLIKGGQAKTLFKVFQDSFLPLAAILLSQMICGFFAVGQPLCAFTLFHRGAAGGISAALIYCEYGLKGFFIIVVMLFPVLVFNMYILIFGARESVRLSNTIVGFLFGKECGDNVSIRLYLIKFLVLTAFALICSVLDSAVTYIFTGLLLKNH